MQLLLPSPNFFLPRHRHSNFSRQAARLLMAWKPLRSTLKDQSITHAHLKIKEFFFRQLFTASLVPCLKLFRDCLLTSLRFDNEKATDSPTQLCTSFIHSVVMSAAIMGTQSTDNSTVYVYFGQHQYFRFPLPQLFVIQSSNPTARDIRTHSHN